MMFLKSTDSLNFSKEKREKKKAIQIEKITNRNGEKNERLGVSNLL